MDLCAFQKSGLKDLDTFHSSISRYTSSMRSSSPLSHSMWLCTSDSVIVEYFIASSSRRVRYMYCHQSSSCGFVPASCRNNTFTRPGGKFGFTSNSSLPSGFSVPSITVSVRLTARLLFLKGFRHSTRTFRYLHPALPSSLAPSTSRAILYGEKTAYPLGSPLGIPPALVGWGAEPSWIYRTSNKTGTSPRKPKSWVIFPA